MPQTPSPVLHSMVLHERTRAGACASRRHKRTRACPFPFSPNEPRRQDARPSSPRTNPVSGFPPNEPERREARFVTARPLRRPSPRPNSSAGDDLLEDTASSERSSGAGRSGRFPSGSTPARRHRPSRPLGGDTRRRSRSGRPSKVAGGGPVPVGFIAGLRSGGGPARRGRRQEGGRPRTLALHLP